MSAAGTELLYVGTYTERLPHVHGKATGIDCYRFDHRAAALTFLHTTAGVINPSFVALDGQRRRLYAASEIAEHADGPGGRVHAYAIDAQDGTLASLNHQGTIGRHPCQLSIADDCVLVANYSSGCVAAFPLRADGGLDAASDHRLHQGSGPNALRQDGPHAHAAVRHPANGMVYVPDLGSDCIWIYRWDPAARRLVPADPRAVAASAGSGPRHLVFSADGAFAYATLELMRSVAVFAVAAGTGALTPIQGISSVPADVARQAQNYLKDVSADLHLHPNGRFLYVLSNRGHDSIAIFAVAPGTGQLGLDRLRIDQRAAPRARLHSSLARSACLLVGNQDTDSIVCFRIDAATGCLSFASEAPARTPVCLALAGAMP